MRRIDQIRGGLLHGLFILSSSRIQVKIVCIVNLISLQREHIRPKLQLQAILPEEISESKLGSTRRELGRLCILLVLDILITVMKLNTHDLRGEHFSEQHIVQVPQQEHMLVIESAGSLLWLLQRLELAAVYKLEE